MPEFCTCGAQLPPDALFCHKCGKPQREELLVETAVEDDVWARAAAAPAPSAMPPEINFHNRVAVRVSLFAASLGYLLSLLFLGMVSPPYSHALLQLIELLSAGFFSVYLYRRRTGQPLSVPGGMRMGWLTGVFSFAIGTVFFTISFFTLALRNGGLASVYRRQLSGMNLPEQSIQQALQVLENPAGLAILVLLSLFFLFAIVTAVPTLGGALGAKVLRKG